jgi:hypothetical protein
MSTSSTPHVKDGDTEAAGQQAVPAEKDFKDCGHLQSGVVPVAGIPLAKHINLIQFN